MEAIAISSIVGIVLFAIGVFCGKSSPCSHELGGISCPYSYPSVVSNVKIAQLENDLYLEKSKVRALEQQRYHVGWDFADAFAYSQSVYVKKFYAKNEKDQKTADLLQGINTNTKDLAKKLDIEIK